MRLAGPLTSALPTGDEEADIEPVVAPVAGDADASASESPGSSPSGSGEEDWVKVARAEPAIVDAAVEPAVVLPATEAVELVETRVAGKGVASALV